MAHAYLHHGSQMLMSACTANKFAKINFKAHHLSSILKFSGVHLGIFSVCLWILYEQYKSLEIVVVKSLFRIRQGEITPSHSQPAMPLAPRALIFCNNTRVLKQI